MKPITLVGILLLVIGLVVAFVLQPNTSIAQGGYGLVVATIGLIVAAYGWLSGRSKKAIEPPPQPQQ